MKRVLFAEKVLLVSDVYRETQIKTLCGELGCVWCRLGRGACPIGDWATYPQPNGSSSKG